MIKNQSNVVITLFTIFLLITCSKDEKNTIQKNLSHNEMITHKVIEQNKKKRKFITASFDSIISINLEKLDSMVYRPSFCRFDKEKNIYLIDYSTLLIHKFSAEKHQTVYTHTVFGNGKGQGPGELINPTDFKIYKGKIFIVDPQTGCIEVYSTEGDYLKRITVEARADKIVPQRLVVFNDKKLLIERRGYPTEALFYFCDYNGNIINGFGSYIDNSHLNTAIYHDNKLTELIDGSYFYYLPYYLGFVGLYKEDSLLFAKATIDGVQKPQVITKEIMKGILGKKLSKKIETAVRYSINQDYNYIIIQAYHRENKKFFFDVYNLKSFDYIFSLNNFPKIKSFDIKGNFLVGVYHNKLTIFNINKLNNQIYK